MILFNFNESCFVSFSTFSSSILVLPQSNDAQKEELELSLIKSLHVLMDGFATVILSVEQGYILYDSKNCNHNKS